MRLRRAPSGRTAGAAPASLTIHSRGRQEEAGAPLLVWEIENKGEVTASVWLEDDAGAVHGTYELPGRTLIHVTSGEIPSKGQMGAWTGTTLHGTDRAKSNPFGRNNPVCTGPGPAVFQLIASDEGGIFAALLHEALVGRSPPFLV